MILSGKPLRQFWLMRAEDNADAAFAGLTGDQPQDFFRMGRVQIADRLIRQDQLWFLCQTAGYGDALTLPPES